MSTVKPTLRSVKILMKEIFTTQTFLNPTQFDFVVWNPGGYIVLNIEGKPSTPSSNLFIGRSVYVNDIKDLSMDQWRTECEYAVREIFLLSQSQDI
uniref:Uncharacterized protein n=1 Tax=Ochrobactrum phage ORM_20 TaxID=2985243 RepID=A0A9N6ZG26_9VIRU|nr:hypothetical protein ORM20_00168 [Ochrobactrum phage ORM_20]